MLTGYKICPRCRLATRLARPSCGRCGHVFGPEATVLGQTQVFRRRPPAAPEPEPPWLSSPPRPTRPSLLALAGLFLMLCGLMAGLALSRPHHRARTLVCSRHATDASSTLAGTLSGRETNRPN